ncbi:carboxylating nicotinate-nucleotide diphosphorylase [Halopelagius longus]|uniref:Nicotinate-nucleotide pyrophosphorylase [carboxylating] n=1 Tax=Halopelagius longus TaxID=1236180 RepID=A0A1H1B635_9EURY|nr:carboxylating nicotinate-nucleotide diphosphorylase [Halopelagius longus]RDI70662.1 carboxylating nicotinate-nucleotide diphosphorylase [Halopelagius longus]SDQ47438.1 nicotinate-nucleotide pyrophosphorylase [carboxylating] [Halopelagius longus]
MLPNATIEAWLREDIGHHDVTNDVPGETTGRLVATEPGVAAGLDAAKAVFEYLGASVTERSAAGDELDAGEAVLEVEGPAEDILRGERVAVNVAGHASGVATKTREAVEAAREAVGEAPDGDSRAGAGDSGVRIAGTRKTTPGLRGVEKRAIVAGGGDTHRLDLSHMVMVKDNHIAEQGLESAVERFRERASFATKIEVEVEDPADAPRAARVGADIVLLDNMTPEETARAVQLVNDAAAELGREVHTEASGGITVETVPDYAATGVDVVSMGSLTHSAPALDYSFRTG